MSIVLAPSNPFGWLIPLRIAQSGIDAKCWILYRSHRFLLFWYLLLLFGSWVDVSVFALVWEWFKESYHFGLVCKYKNKRNIQKFIFWSIIEQKNVVCTISVVLPVATLRHQIMSIQEGILIKTFNFPHGMTFSSRPIATKASTQ